MKWDLLRIIGKRLRYRHGRLAADPLAAAMAARPRLLRLPGTLVADQLIAEMPRGREGQNAPGDVPYLPKWVQPQISECAVDNWSECSARC